MKKTPKPSITVILLSIVFTGCNDSVTSDRIDLASLQRQFQGTTAPKALYEEKIVSDRVPQSRDELSSMRTVVKVYNGAHDAGLTVPGFGGVKLGKSETNLNVYYVETKIVKTGTDTLVYGIGYSTHYLFKKLKRGIDVSNLASVAASAQLESNKTSGTNSVTVIPSTRGILRQARLLKEFLKVPTKSSIPKSIPCCSSSTRATC